MEILIYNLPWNVETLYFFFWGESIYILIPQDLQISQKHQSIKKTNGSENKSHTFCLSFKFATQLCLETDVSLSSSQVVPTQDKNRWAALLLAQLSLLYAPRTGGVESLKARGGATETMGCTVLQRPQVTRPSQPLPSLSLRQRAVLPTLLTLPSRLGWGARGGLRSGLQRTLEFLLYS